ncbi:hypothetical protein E2562_003080 [Oryza meyeriana var. granulata]|uniref:RING-type domain-containing protein n=1 Tax=Oryza meyeriana var. granulata TaxID=110450 RepID=A0A6G1EA15_9ORYZ|nr:hypothetical protein E2562_003080 [Oryza meyeriana var. granulata]
MGLLLWPHRGRALPTVPAAADEGVPSLIPVFLGNGPAASATLPRILIFIVIIVLLHRATAVSSNAATGDASASATPAHILAVVTVLLHRATVASSSTPGAAATPAQLLLPPPPPFLLSPNSTTRDYYIISSSEDAPEQPLSRLDSLDYFYFGISTDPDTSPHTGGLETSPRPPPHSMIYNSFVSDHLRGGSSQAASDESFAALSTVTVTVSDTAEVCAVCTDALPLATTASRLPCGHLYHSDCIVQWLSLRNSCPVCRRSIQMLPAAFTDEIIVPSLPPNNDPQPTADDQEIAPSPPLPGPRPTMANNHLRRSLPGARRIRKICRRLLNYMGREPSATAN